MVGRGSRPFDRRSRSRCWNPRSDVWSSRSNCWNSRFGDQRSRSLEHRSRLPGRRSRRAGRRSRSKGQVFPFCGRRSRMAGRSSRSVGRASRPAGTFPGRICGNSRSAIPAPASPVAASGCSTGLPARNDCRPAPDGDAQELAPVPPARFLIQTFQFALFV